MRLFLALWPGVGVRDSLAQVAASLAERASGKPVAAAKIHLTLAFLGEVAPARVDQIREVASGVHARPFDLVLDGVGSFRRARVAWAGASQVPPALARLQADLELGLRARRFALDDRPFAAHVTLVRKIAAGVAPAAMTPIAWRADEYVLVRSETGTGRYSMMEAWRLDQA